jgi:hypothetical protein
MAWWRSLPIVALRLRSALNQPCRSPRRSTAGTPGLLAVLLAVAFGAPAAAQELHEGGGSRFGHVNFIQPWRVAANGTVHNGLVA